MHQHTILSFIATYKKYIMKYIDMTHGVFVCGLIYIIKVAKLLSNVYI